MFAISTSIAKTVEASVTKKVIEELGGAIKVKSEVGCGTTSTVWLPFPGGELQ